MRLRNIVGVIATSRSSAFSPDLSLARRSSDGDDGVGGSVATLLEGSAIAVSQYSSIAGNRASRVSVFLRKDRSESLALAEMSKCRLLERDPVQSWLCVGQRLLQTVALLLRATSKLGAIAFVFRRKSCLGNRE
jgi:hypothetical protein